MFDTPELQQAIIKGMRKDPSIISIVRTVKNNRKRIERRIHNTDRRVSSDNILVRLLGGLQLTKMMTYEEVYWICRRGLTRVANSVGATNPSGFGKTFVGQFIPEQDEIISIVANDIDSEKNWRKYSPVRYLYHPHTNVDWELASAKAQGVSFIEINLVELAWQFVCGLRYAATQEPDARPNIFVWLYRYAVYPMLPSYFNLSIFNRHFYCATDTDIPKDKSNPIYSVPDISGELDRHVKLVKGYLQSGSPLPASCLNHVMLVMLDNKLDYFTAIALPVDTGYNWQQRWVYELVNMHFMLFALAYKNDSMVKFLPRIKRELRALKQLRIIPKMPAHLQVHINREVINKLESALQ